MSGRSVHRDDPAPVVLGIARAPRDGQKAAVGRPADRGRGHRLRGSAVSRRKRKLALDPRLAIEHPQSADGRFRREHCQVVAFGRPRQRDRADVDVERPQRCAVRGQDRYAPARRTDVADVDRGQPRAVGRPFDARAAATLCARIVCGQEPGVPSVSRSDPDVAVPDEGESLPRGRPGSQDCQPHQRRRQQQGSRSQDDPAATVAGHEPPQGTGGGPRRRKDRLGDCPRVERPEACLGHLSKAQRQASFEA